MAATNFTPIILYHTTTASAAPTAGNLNNGELAINITDGKLFYKDNGGTVQVIATKGTGTIGGSNTQVQYNSSGALAGSANFTFNGTTATINTLNLTNALGTAYGGTALTTYTQGDLVYASAANTLAKLGIGANTYILTSTGSVPQWSAPSAVTVATANNLAGGAAGSVPYQSGASTTTFLSIGTSGQILSSTGSAPQWSSPAALTKTDDTNVTLTLGGSASTALVNAASLTLGWTGQLSIARGGTNATATPTAGAVAYGTGTAYAFTAAGTSGQILTSSGAGAPTWTSLSSVGVTTFSAGTTGFTPSTATSGAITLAGTLATTNGGTGLTSFTANGVVYASSSSALTTGSALTFDGSQFFANSNSTTTPGFFQVNDGTTTQANSFVTIARNANDGNGRYSLSAWRAQNASGLTQYSYIGTQSVAGAANYTPEMVFGLSTGASTYAEQMRLTSTGLGIGTSPTQSLDVNGNVIFRIASATTSRTLGFTTSNGVDGWTIGNGVTASANQFVIYSNTAGAARLLIDSSGNSGIGTTSPAYKLDVSSSSEVVGRFARSAGSNALLLIQDPTTTTAPYIASYGNAMAFGRYGGGETVRIDGNGNFLVNTTTSITGSNRMVVRQSGTSNPSTALNSGSWTGAFVSGEPALQLSSNIIAATGASGSTETARGGIGFEYISSANPTDFVIGIFGSPTVASPVKFFNGSERARITSGGLVLVNGTSSADSSTYIQAFSPSGNSNNGYIGIFTGGSGATSANQNLGVYFGSTNNSIRTTYDGSGNARNELAFRTNGADAMFVSSAGFLGLNDSSPNFRLTNAGHAAFTNSTTGTDGAGDPLRNGVGWLATGSAGVLSALVTAANSGNWGADLQFYTRPSAGGAMQERARIATSTGALLVGTTDTSLANRLAIVGSTGVVRVNGGNTSTNITSGTPDQFLFNINDSTVGNFFQFRFTNQGGNTMMSVGVQSTSHTANFNNGKFFVEPNITSTPATFIVDGTNAYSYFGYSSSNGAYKIQVNGQIFATSSTIATSDGRYKENVQDLTGALDLVKLLRPVSFNWKKHNVHNFNTVDTTVGFIAQEVQQAMADKPYLNSFIKVNKCTSYDEVEQKDCDEEFMGLAETNMIAILTKALQELNAKFEAYVASHP